MPANDNTSHGQPAGQSVPVYEPRAMPSVAKQYLASLRRRDARALEPFAGGSYADRHLAETGHPFERGCCTQSFNRCAGCRIVLPREAKVKGERYCSRSCREAHTKA